MPIINLKIINETKHHFKFYDLFVSLARSLAVHHKFEKKVEINVLIITTDQMMNLYKTHLGYEKSADVLAFPGEWKTLLPIIGYYLLGDIYMAYEVIKIQADDYQNSLEREWSYLFCHSFLHLLGYDHQDDESELEMHNIIKKVLLKHNL